MGLQIQVDNEQWGFSVVHTASRIPFEKLSLVEGGLERFDMELRTNGKDSRNQDSNVYFRLRELQPYSWVP